jgi:diadenosine tetraphosphatase ApaH/serine/threonine PP2A family protein phosphatase
MTAHSEDTVERTDTAPRRVAILSDVHGNLPALEAVLAAIGGSQAEAIWCLGDLVGYGAQPDECVSRVAQACDVCLVGNHDLVVLGKLDIATFSEGAAAAARWTADRIAPESADYLTALEPARPDGQVGLFHGSPADPVWEYLLSNQAADASMDLMGPRVGLIGHSHVALCFRRPEGGRASGELAPDETTANLSEGQWLLNPGAVGQPRDGDPRAAWLLLDLVRQEATWHRVDYPIDAAANAIRDAGLPAMLADRLYYGQ